MKKRRLDRLLLRSRCRLRLLLRLGSRAFLRVFRRALALSRGFHEGRAGRARGLLRARAGYRHHAGGTVLARAGVLRRRLRQRKVPGPARGVRRAIRRCFFWRAIAIRSRRVGVRLLAYAPRGDGPVGVDTRGRGNPARFVQLLARFVVQKLAVVPPDLEPVVHVEPRRDGGGEQSAAIRRPLGGHRARRARGAHELVLAVRLAVEELHVPGQVPEPRQQHEAPERVPAHGVVRPRAELVLGLALRGVEHRRLRGHEPVHHHELLARGRPRGFVHRTFLVQRHLAVQRAVRAHER
mmetsp:Transcript_14749/g.62259  ORF Transcript_14749/g.62259 Transcript_14749/m.62259 type:complete len:295 (+) Transcript_14749:41-925(+)